MRWGVGQIMVWAVPCNAPDAVTLRLAGSPASPGLSQYVCHPGLSCRRRATWSGAVALAVLASVIRVAVLWALTTGALCAACAAWGRLPVQASATPSSPASPVASPPASPPASRATRSEPRKNRGRGACVLAAAGAEHATLGAGGWVAERRINVSFQHRYGSRGPAYAKPGCVGNGSCARRRINARSRLLHRAGAQTGVSSRGTPSGAHRS